ncbi:CHASE2 domain-containing protein [Lusitaniella coriacea LEGE 07157]|uniref:CHASE2 domain-containing protein n=1 Tax=Lusitaniella coriacea LEGE 07157 TaxID=945747 RepID=A0A8J7IS63_9CYAN|nr:CHASE2 domain-containing protein [Lusitaniella coriacea]MBE9115937.1 CHASE2 domain-containing protein [Lusitaniella coriacea LEGE 07157]
MSKLVILNFGNGTLEEGCPAVTVRVEAEDRTPLALLNGNLPPASELLEIYHRWQLLYLLLYDRFRGIEIDNGDITNVSYGDFEEISQELKRQINHWLDSEEFQHVKLQLFFSLAANDEVRVIIQTEDEFLRKLPWHQWDFFGNYHRSEVVVSNLSIFQPQYPIRKAKVKILAILGDSTGINVEEDRKLLAALPNAEVEFLVKPKRKQLNDRLWEEGWDILFFAGHSVTSEDGETGHIYINRQDRLSIADLEYALGKAIYRGLQLAIFNSCDGLGLAQELADLRIPQMVAMRESVPDRVAQEFLKYFLNAFSAGQSFYLSVRDAREQLQGLENELPGASWLPVICQNHTQIAPIWNDFLLDRPQWTWWKRFSLVCGVGAIASGLIMGTRFLGVMQPVELSAYDHLMRLRPAEQIDNRLLVVEVTEEDVKKYGYPLEDRTLAKLLQNLNNYKPRAIGVDMHRYRQRGEGREDFISQFDKHSNLFLVCAYGIEDRNYAPPPEFSPNQLKNQVGFSDLPIDDNPNENIFPVRRQLLSHDSQLHNSPTPCQTPFSFSFHLAFRFLYEDAIDPPTPNERGHWQLGKVAFKSLKNRTGGYQNLGEHNQILLNYRSIPKSGQISRKITLRRVLEEEIDRQLIEGKAILIGTTAAVANDSLNTPYGSMSGVWVHAHMVSQMLSAAMEDRTLIWTLPQWGDALFVLAWSVAGGFLAWRSRTLLFLLLKLSLASIILHQLCLVFLIYGGWMPLIPSGMALWGTAIAVKGGFIAKRKLELRGQFL